MCPWRESIIYQNDLDYFLWGEHSRNITHTFFLLYELNQFLQDFIQNPADTKRGGKHRQDGMSWHELFPFSAASELRARGAYENWS